MAHGGFARMLDELDERLLAELSRNARASFRKIAQRLGVSVSTAIQRVKSLEQAGIIRGYTMLADAEKAGYELTALIEVTRRKGTPTEVEKKIAALPNVIAVYDVTGSFDAMVIAKFRNRSELNKFVKGLLAMENIERTNTHFVLNVIKEDPRILNKKTF